MVRRLLPIIVMVIAVGAVMVGVKVKDLVVYQKRVADIEIAEVNLARVPDGVYEGCYDAGLVSARVKVSVSKHRIDGIEIVEHLHGRGGEAEGIPDKVVEAQSLMVDAVSGCTSSSKVILKAIENALGGP